MNETPTVAPDINREAWLTAAAAKLAPVFADHGYTMPAVRVSVGFPGGRGPKTGVIGQCWSTGAAKDSVSQIFIHPRLEDPMEILGVLTHELAHAIDDCESGHKGQFVKIIRAMGLTGKPTHAITFDEESAETISNVLEVLGAYPHAALGAIEDGELIPGEKKQSTRMLKMVCSVDGLDSPYKVRMTRKIINEFGAPLCPCHSEPMEEAAA